MSIDRKWIFFTAFVLSACGAQDIVVANPTIASTASTLHTLTVEPPIPTQTVIPTETVVPTPDIPSQIESFRQEVINGKEKDITGVVAFDPTGVKLFDLHIVQQNGNDAYVDPDFATEMFQFKRYDDIPWRFVVLVERLNDAGKDLATLQIGDINAVIFGDGHVRYYKIYNIIDGVVDTPNDPHSSINLSDLGSVDANTAAHHIYVDDVLPLVQGSELVEQTCFEVNGDLNGRRFLVSEEIFIPQN